MVLINWKTIARGKEKEVDRMKVASLQAQIVEIYRESGLFLNVEGGMHDTDYTAEIVLVDEGSFNMASVILTGLTLFLIPTKSTDNFILETKINDDQDNLLGTFKKEEAVTFWLHLFSKRSPTANIYEEVTYDLNRATIKEAHAEGIF